MIQSPQFQEIFPRIKKSVEPYIRSTASYNFLNSLPHQTKICIACSGGSDSVFLTLMFCALFSSLAPNASILHLNHNLRGQESDDDERYVQELAKKLGLNCLSGKLKRSDTFLSEGDLHDIRHKFFEKKMYEIGAKILLLGQQKNDVAETIIMRLSRASGLEGLSAPHEIRKFSNGQIKIRPILFISKEKIESILSDLGIQWRIDSSNLCCDYFRNKVRHVVLKTIQKFAKQYDIVENFAESQKQIVEANEAIEELATKYLNEMNLSDKLDLVQIGNLPVAILRRILNKWLLHNKIIIKKSEFDSLLLQIHGKESSTFNCLNDKQLQLKKNILQIIDPYRKSVFKKFSMQWTHGEIFLPNGKSLRRTSLTIDQEFLKKMSQCEVTSEAYVTFCETFTVTNFCAEEKYVRFGHKTPKKLKGILGQKIENFEIAPMIYWEETLCWVPGLPISNIYKIKAGEKRALLLTYS